MDVLDTLRAAAYALSDRTDLTHALALAGLLHNRADDMERNIAVWRRAGRDVTALKKSTTTCTSLLPELFFSIHVTAMTVPRRPQNKLKGNSALRCRK